MRPFGTSGAARDHREALELLPWYVNGTLDGDELARFELHLQSCRSCRTETEQQRRLAHALRTSEELAFLPQRAFERLGERLVPTARPPLGESEDLAPGLGDRRRRSFGTLAAPVRWALAAQLLVIVALAAVLAGEWRRPTEFRTLSAPAEVPTATGLRLRVVFEDEAREGDVRALLLAARARMIGGPSPFGVYTIEIAGEAGAAEAVVGLLRSSGLVAFVEPVTAGEAPRP